MPDLCEGPKRTSTGSELDRLLSWMETVFTEIAVFVRNRLLFLSRLCCSAPMTA